MIILSPAEHRDCTGLARVQVDSYLNTYAGILPQAYLDHISYEDQEQDWFELLNLMGEHILTVALDSQDGVIGYSLGKPNPQELPPYQGELVALHVRRDFQHRGVGRRLFTSLYDALRVADCSSLFAWVLRNNPACGFYERLGGVCIAQKGWQNNHYFGTDIQEVAYGWMDHRSKPLSGIG